MTSRQVLLTLRKYESRNVTFLEPDGSWPIIWDRAKGVEVWDAHGTKYLDLTAAFGVAAAGHANPRVVKAGQLQMARLLHAMGDVHPHALKAVLARELSRLTFERWRKSVPDHRTSSQVQRPQSRVVSGKTIFCNSGFEAVEAALKTAKLATGKSGLVVFEGAYHGLGYGTLNATHREHFRAPFRSQIGGFGYFVPFPSETEPSRLQPKSAKHPQVTGRTLETLEARISRIFRRHNIGAVLVEPIQVRGGINIPPRAFLPLLRSLCDEHKSLLIVDEIYTGFGRTGEWFACEHSGVTPDLICLGKALTGGFPLSACVGSAQVMDAAWPASTGEAIHTSTFLGHPVGCAMALAQIGEIRRLGLVEQSARLGEALLHRLQSRILNLEGRSGSSPGASKLRISARGVGLLAGLELRRQNGDPAGSEAMRVIKAMLHRGFILLPEGQHANIISFTPPLTIAEPELARAVDALAETLTWAKLIR